MTEPPESSRSKLELLKSLGARVRPASELLEHQPHTTTPPHKSSRKRASLTEMLPGAERVTFEGKSCVRIVTRAALTGQRTPQGYSCPAASSADVGALRDRLRATVHLLARGAAAIDPEQITFIDTETTSLSGGAGAVVFLAGSGRFDFSGPTPEFVVTQYFMEDYDQEPAFIEALGVEMSSARALASYNGRCFDVPILESRWRMHRRRPEFPAIHFDLLHPARRLWKRRLSNCRLGTIERQLLGLVRFSDVESSLVPRIFNDCVRGIHPERILMVLDHHAQDIFSLAALMSHLARGMHDPTRPEFAQAEDQWGLSGIFQQAGRDADSIQCLERAAASARDEAFGFRLAMHLARRLMRIGRAEEAVEIFTARANEERPERIEAHIELAKYAEHKQKDFVTARMWTERAINLVSKTELRTREKLEPEVQKRLDRIIQRSA